MGRLLRLRWGVALLMTALGVTFACAVLLVFSRWTPGGLTSHEVYNWAFTAHGAPMLVLLPSVLLLLSELGEAPPSWRPPWLLPTACVALVLEALAIVVILVAPDAEKALWSRWVGVAFLPPSVLMAASVLMRLGRTARARDLALAFAAMVQLVAIGLVLPLDLAKRFDPLGHPDFFSFGHVFTGALVEATALAAVAAALGENRGRRGPIFPVAVLALTIFVPRESLIQLPASLAATACAVWLVALALKRRDVPPSVWERVFTSLAAFTLLQAVVAEQFLRLMSADIPLDDTYFVVGSFHLRVTTCLVAALAVGFRQSPRDGRQVVASVAAVLCIVGSQLMAFAMFVVGSRGMPRRYFHYLPEFQPWHRAIAVGGSLLILGIGFALFDILKRRSTPQSPEEH